MLLYNFALRLYAGLIRLAARWNPKAKLWVEGRRDWRNRLREAFGAAPGAGVVWVHVASLGEFEQGRPVIERIRSAYPNRKILVTFYSPSGYEIRKNYPGADCICYLPLDTPGNVRAFLDIVQPEIAIFVKYEFWLNMLRELRRRSIDTYIISAIFRRNSVFFRWYGGLWRKALRSFRILFVQNEGSKELLAGLGFDNVVVAGDTRFDRVAQLAAGARRIERIERFRDGQRLFVAGSTWGPDEELLIRLMNDNPAVKFVVAPHEMEEGRIERLLRAVKGGGVRYTQCTETTAFDACQLLVLDTVGLLGSVYGYATWSYIGGGFGVGIHNTLEAATFGLPIAFGPNYRKFKEACDLVELGGAASVSDYAALERWFAPLRDDADCLAQASRISKAYTARNQGASELIFQTIFSDRK